MERRLGEEFEYKGIHLRVDKNENKLGGSCKGCYFHENDIFCGNHFHVIGECRMNRADKTPVIFKKVDAPEQPTTDEPKPSFKNDRIDGKPRWELLPLPDLEDVVKVYTFGAEKYGVGTWRELDDPINRYSAALMRHLVSFQRGEEFDEESGLPALAHMAWNAIAMLAIWHDKNKKRNQPA